MAGPIYDRHNGILEFNTTGQTTVGDNSIARPFLIEGIVLEGASAASTISDGQGSVIATITTMDFYRPVNRWVTDIVGTTIGASAKVRVYLSAARR